MLEGRTRGLPDACDNSCTPSTGDWVAAGTQRTKQGTRGRRADYGMPIGPYFEALPADKRAPLEQLRAIVEATVPEAQSSLKWGSPFYTIDGKLLCAMGALKNEVALSIYGPPEIFEDPGGLLQGKSPEYRVLKVRDGSEIDAASVARWLRAAAAART